MCTSIAATVERILDGRDSYIDAYARSMLESARDLPVSFLGFISNRECAIQAIHCFG